MKSINLETILDQFDKHKTISEAQKSDILPAMMEACRQVIKLATENSRLKIEYGYSGNTGSEYNSEDIVIDKQSILDTINQIEIYEVN